MDSLSVLYLLLGTAVGALAATGWWRRPLQASRARVSKLEAAREALKQQNAQARKQIEQLQAELAELRHALGKVDAARAQALRVQAASRERPDTGPFLGDAAPHLSNSDGFAQTQVFLPKPE